MQSCKSFIRVFFGYTKIKKKNVDYIKPRGEKIQQTSSNATDRIVH